MATVREFLEVLFPSDLGGAFIEVRLIKPGHVLPIFYESVDQLVNALPRSFEEQGGCNVYFGVCLRSRREGTKDAIKVVRCLWVDLDAKDFSGGKPEALKRLREFAFSPTLIGDSGHGYHAYWLLKEPEEITRPEDLVKVEACLKALARALGGDPQATDISRVLRLPGTYNVKDPSAPVLATLAHFEPDRQYNLSEFESLLSADPLEQTEQANPPGWITQALAELHEGNRNATFAKIVGRLHRDGWLPEDIFTLLIPHAERCGFSLSELRQEIESLCQRYPSRKSSPSAPYK